MDLLNPLPLCHSKPRSTHGVWRELEQAARRDSTTWRPQLRGSVNTRHKSGCRAKAHRYGWSPSSAEVWLCYPCCLPAVLLCHPQLSKDIPPPHDCLLGADRTDIPLSHAAASADASQPCRRHSHVNTACCSGLCHEPRVALNPEAKCVAQRTDDFIEVAATIASHSTVRSAWSASCGTQRREACHHMWSMEVVAL